MDILLSVAQSIRFQYLSLIAFYLADFFVVAFFFVAVFDRLLLLVLVWIERSSFIRQKVLKKFFARLPINFQHFLLA